MIFRREFLFPLVIGPVDGILTALTLAAGRMVMPGQPIDVSLAVRIASAVSVSGGFLFFVAEYARLRGELIHAEQHLDLSRAGLLATTKLGKDVLHDSFRGASITAAAGFGGAMLPLGLGALFPAISLMAIVTAVAVLGLLGVLISREVRGSPIYWPVALMVTSVLFSAVGVLLHVA